MSRVLLVTCWLLLSFPHLWAQEVRALNIGESLEFQSELLGEKRQIHVYLPDAYQWDSTASFPVIYLLDGGKDEDFIHIVGLVQFASFPWVKMLPPSIVVGIVNVDRRRDFTFPTTNPKDQKDYPTPGQSANFIRFLAEEVQPLVEKRYRTDQTRILIGQSFGGLFATEVLFTRPALFSHYLIVSPSLWWDDQSLLAIRPAFQKDTFSDRITAFVAVGKEREIMEKDARALVQVLKEADEDKVRSVFHYMGDQDHGNILHLAIYQAFEILFQTE